MIIYNSHLYLFICQGIIILQLTDMEIAQRRNIRSNLKKILLQVKDMKKQIKQLYTLHQKFTFISLLPKEFSYSVKKYPVLEENKENNCRKINEGNLANKKTQTKSPKISNHKKTSSSYIRELENQKENIQNFKNKSDQIKDLKATMIMQLTQIKSMEKKQEALRRASQKIKAYNSQQKRNYRESISKDKQESLKNSEASFKPSLANADDSLLRSDISISIPISIENRHKTLYCKKGHQCYEGFVNSKDQPNGNGRLQICCSQIPVQIAYRNLKDSEFYQGQFKDGLFHGFGTLSYKGGVKYVGEFRQGRRHGKGSMYHNGKSEVAKWQNDIFISIM